MDIRLEEISDKYLNDIWDYRQELIDIDDSFDGTICLKSSKNKEDFLNNCIIKENDPSGFVPNSLYVSIRNSDNKVVGLIDLRHHINHPILKEIGGHIGYNIRPSERRKGYGTEQLSLCLLKAKELGLDKVLVTCLNNNEGSKRIILANGGIYERDSKDRNKVIERYWIELK